MEKARAVSEEIGERMFSEDGMTSIELPSGRDKFCSKAFGETLAPASGKARVTNAMSLRSCSARRGCAPFSSTCHFQAVSSLSCNLLLPALRAPKSTLPMPLAMVGWKKPVSSRLM